MNLLLTGDWHITDKKPVNRIDDSYFKTVLSKLQQILTLAKQYKCNAILQPGDFFDSFRTPDYVKAEIIIGLKEFTAQTNCQVFTIYGQHDLRFHGNKHNTPLMLLHKAGVLTILDEECAVLKNKKERVVIQGIPWFTDYDGLDLSQIKDATCSIVMLHKMIIKDKLWEQQEDFLYGRNLFRRLPHDVFVCGDNHQSFSFTANKGKRIVVNCGSLMRNTIKQYDHIPCVYILDTVTKEVLKKELNVHSHTDVFDVEKVEVAKEIASDLDTFIRNLDGSEYLKELDFISRISKLVKSPKIKPEVKKIIRTVMEDIT